MANWSMDRSAYAEEEADLFYEEMLHGESPGESSAFEDVTDTPEVIPSHQASAGDRRARRWIRMPAHVESFVPNRAGTGLVLERERCNTMAQLTSAKADAATEIATLPLWRSAAAVSGSPVRLETALDLLVYHPAPTAGGTTFPRGRFPLVVICMGNHNAYVPTGSTHPEIESFKGYSGFATTTPSGATGEYLQEALAKIGIVSVSVSTNGANLLNLFIETRANYVVKAIEEMQRLNRVRGRYRNKIDFSRVALIGHSRGGDAVMRALALMPSGVTVKTVAMLAPTDITGVTTGAAPSGGSRVDFIRRPMRTRASNRLFHYLVWGSRDGDVSGQRDVRTDELGGPFRHYDRSSAPRALHFWHGGTHNRFNRFWTHAQEGSLVGSGGLLTRPEQERRTVEVMRSLMLFTLHAEKPEARLLDGRRRTAVATSKKVAGIWKFGRRLRTIDRFDDVRPTRNTMGGRNRFPATGIYDEVTIANENPPGGGTTNFQIPHVDRALRFSPAPPGLVSHATPRWRTEIPARFRRFDRYDLLTLRVTKKYNPAALVRPTVRVHLSDGTNRHAVTARGRLSTLPEIRTVAGLNLTKFHYETWEVPLSTYRSNGVRLDRVRFVELEMTTRTGEPVYVDTLSLVKRP